MNTIELSRLDVLWDLPTRVTVVAVTPVTFIACH